MNKYFIILTLFIVLLLLLGCEKSNKMEQSSHIQDYIGLSIADAQALAASKKLKFRVVKQDGEEFGLTMDFLPSRINAVVENGVVISYVIEGENRQEKNRAHSAQFNQNSWKTVIDKSCQNFFDGCNNCKRIKGESNAACTRKMCKNSYEEPMCLDN